MLKNFYNEKVFFIELSHEIFRMKRLISITPCSSLLCPAFNKIKLVKSRLNVGTFWDL